MVNKVTFIGFKVWSP